MGSEGKKGMKEFAGKEVGGREGGKEGRKEGRQAGRKKSRQTGRKEGRKSEDEIRRGHECRSWYSLCILAPRIESEKGPHLAFVFGVCSFLFYFMCL